MKATFFEQAYGDFKNSGVSNTINYDLFNRFLLTHHSTKLEGSTLTELDTRLLIEKGITPKGKPLQESNMVNDHYKALQYALDRAKRKDEITEAFIKKIGAIINKSTGKVTNTALGTFDDRLGDYRLANAFAGDDYFLSYNKIEYHMKKLVNELNQKNTRINGIDEVYKLAFDAQFYLIEIHPFGDGNGRTARLIMNYIQSYHKLPLTPVFADDKKDYIEALKKSRSEDNTNAIRSFMFFQATRYFKHEVAAKKKMREKISFGKGKNSSHFKAL